MEEEKHSHFTQLPDSWLYRKDITVYDCRTMHALMSFCTTEGTHKVNMNQLANIGNISVSILCTTNEQAKKPKEGILDKFHRMGYITLIYAREVDPLTRQPKGQVKTYIHMNYTKIWEDNDAFFQTYRPLGINSCLVEEDSFIEDPKRVRLTNDSIVPTNRSIIPANDPTRLTSGSIRHSSSNFTRYDPDTSRDSLDTKKDTPSPLSPEALLIFNWCVEDGEYDPKLETKVIGYCEEIAKDVKTREQYNSRRDVARSMIHGEDKTVYLGNIASKRTLNAWKKQSQQSPEGLEDDYIEGVGMPADTYNLAARMCRKYQIKLDPGEYITKELERIYRLVKSKSRFERLLRDAGEKSAVIEDFLKQLEDGISVKL